MIKTLRFTLFALVPAFLAFFSGCKKSDSETTAASNFKAPAVSLVSVSVPNVKNTGDLQQDSSAVVKVRATAAAGLQSLTFKKRVGSLEYVVAEAALPDSGQLKDVTIAFPFTYSDREDSTSLIFIAVDSLGKRSRYTFVFYASPTVYLKNPVTSQLYPDGYVATSPASVSFLIKVNSGVPISQIVVSEVVGSVKTKVFTKNTGFATANTDSFNYSYDVRAGQGKKFNILVEALTATGHSGNSSLTYTVLNKMNVLQNLTLCAQNCNQNGNFFSSLDAGTWKAADRNTIPNYYKQDLVYYWDSVKNEAYLAGPQNAIADSMYGAYIAGPSNWNRRNNTLLRESRNSIDDFDNLFGPNSQDMTTLLGFYNSYRASTDYSKVKISEGMVVAYKTSLGRYGILKIKTINKGFTGSVVFDARYQNF